jgi:hypothetical protein
MTDETTSCLNRGGSWCSAVRVTYRYLNTPGFRYFILGVRLVEVIENTDDY